MTLEEMLKAQGLTDEQIAKITGEMKENKIYTTNEENIDIRYNKLKTERDDLKGKLDTADNTIKDLKEANKDNEILQATIKTHEDTIENMKTDYETKIRDMSIQQAIQSKLTNTKYPELLETKFDKAKLSISEDGTVLGIDEQLTSIKETYKDLFIPVVTGKLPKNNVGIAKGVTKEQFDQMSYKEKLDLFNNDPETYRQLNE